MKFPLFSGWVKRQPSNDILDDCPFCRGAKQQRCSMCDGEGQLDREDDEGVLCPTCRDCDGEGFIPCESCAATGKNYRQKYNSEIKRFKVTLQSWGVTVED